MFGRVIYTPLICFKFFDPMNFVFSLLTLNIYFWVVLHSAWCWKKAKHTLKILRCSHIRFLKDVWPFFNIPHERVIITSICYSFSLSTFLENTIVVVTTAVTLVGNDENSYKYLFCGFLVAFAITLILLLLLCVVLFRLQQKTNTEIDGLEKNGHIANGHISWFKKYKMNRNDSASRELIKQKNRNQVYKDTTTEMNERKVWQKVLVNLWKVKFSSFGKILLIQGAGRFWKPCVTAILSCVWFLSFALKTIETWMEELCFCLHKAKEWEFATDTSSLERWSSLWKMRN